MHEDPEFRVAPPRHVPTGQQQVRGKRRIGIRGLARGALLVGRSLCAANSRNEQGGGYAKRKEAQDRGIGAKTSF
ncbi:hypothetical protein [Sphingomonas sp.]|uniref:hypothetical protein n=1 Tax=Sphingomonas sp. TaxID=28214 RepID=UPI0025F5E3C9|nr:hypothetical protein [Sphingomonas sp.]